jgi:hypothetical protein
MEYIEKEQNSPRETNQDNNNDFSNIKNSKLNQKEEKNTKNQLKLGEFNFTPLECLILNKKMPYGFKFEVETNISKSSEQSKTLIKRNKEKEKDNHNNVKRNLINADKNLNKNNNSPKENLSNNNTKKLKKIVTKENISNNNKNSNSESYKIMMKCNSGLDKIKSNPKSNFFYHSKIPNSPSLSGIEKKIKNFEYKTVNEFCEDLRKLWNFQFKNYAKEPSIYQNICKLSLLSDQICKELSNENVTENKREEISNIKKRTEKIKKDLDEIKGNNLNENNNKINRRENMEKINHLASLIRRLDKQQLKGIIPILSDNNENNNSKMFEFDLEQLPYDKFKKLEEYVKSCFANDKKKHNNNYTNNNNNNNNNNKNTHLNNGINKALNKKDNKAINNNNNNKQIQNDKTNITKKINNTSENVINNRSNINEKNKINQSTNEKDEEKKIISEKKTFSDSDSLSSDSSLSN